MKRRLRKIIFLLLAATMVAGMLCLTSTAANIRDSGYCGGKGDGTNLTWTLDSEGTLTISGTGKMADFQLMKAPWRPSGSSTQIRNIVIREGVTSIGNYAFSSCHSLSTVSIPSTVEKIGVFAFYYNESLESVEIPNGVLSIGEKAFWACGKITDVTIPESVISLGDDVFGYCSSLQTIEVDAGNRTFCSVDGVLFDKSVSKLLAYPFAGNAVYAVPECVTEIGAYAFSGCSGLKQLSLPDDLLAIRDSAFMGCKSMESITLPEGLQQIGKQVFDSCSGLKTLVMPDSVTVLGENAFQFCGLRFAELSSGLTEIKRDLFYYCSNLQCLVIPSGIRTVGADAFYSCKALNTIHYTGTASEWSSIVGMTDASFDTSIVHFGCTTVVDHAVEPTCTDSGFTEGRSCAKCGAALISQEAVPTLGHIAVIDQAVSTSCTESGLTEGSHCGRCDEVLVPQEVIPALGHTFAVTSAVPATCTEPCLTAGLHCTVCGVILVPQEVVPATGHRYAVQDAITATCTGAGLTVGFYCSDCGEVFVAQEFIPALGHDWALTGGIPGVTEICTCTRCHETETELILEPDVTFDGGWIALTVESGEALLRVSVSAPATALLASYDAAGRLLSTRVIPLQPGFTERTVPVPGERSTLYLVDESGRPLCESVTK